MSSPRLAAVVVAYNGGQKLRDCIESLLLQTVRDLEVILVDNASTDGSVGDAERAFGHRIRVIPRSVNGGYAAGANTGWRSTNAEYVVILNQDLTFAADCLEQMVRALESAPGQALVCPKLVLASDPDVVNTIGNDVHLSGVAWCRGLGTTSAGWHGTIEVPAVSGAAILARRSFLETLGGMDESFFMYYEDVDISVRARLAGARCLAACDAVVRHDWSLALTPWKFQLLERNRRAFWQQLWGRSMRMRPVLWQAEAMAWAYALMRGRDYLGAKWAAARAPLKLPALGEQDRSQPRDGLLGPWLSRRHPYDVLFPGRAAIGFLGAAVDRLTTALL